MNSTNQMRSSPSRSSTAAQTQPRSLSSLNLVRSDNLGWCLSPSCSISLTLIQFTYTHGDKSLVLEPLKGQINTEASDFTVGKIKVEVRLVKRVQGRWGSLIGDSPDRGFLSFPASVEWCRSDLGLKP